MIQCGTWLRLCIVAGASFLAVLPAAAQTAPPEGPAVWEYLAGLPREARLATLEREAKREGGFTIYGALGIDRAQILNKLFNERYPDVKVNFVRLTEADLTDKVLLENRTNRVNSDLALSTVAWTISTRAFGWAA
jgi:iron(III) transport system substrate-binding protein